MPSKNYPEHDINVVIDYIHSIVTAGHVAENAPDEMSFLNRLFAALPAEAVEYGMQFLHGRRDLPASCDEILPLYIRFTNLLEYCEIVEKMEEIPVLPTPEELQIRIRMNQTLDELEKPFCTPLLGFKYKKDLPEGTIDPASLPSGSGRNTSNETGAEETSHTDSSPNQLTSSEAQDESSSSLHLMNDIAPVFLCRDALRTALFYEETLGFHAAHLDDESMPHIRLRRDNIEIVLVSCESEELVSDFAQVQELKHKKGLYDLYIFASEPKMLQMELRSSGVTILRSLEEADRTPHKNREFTFTDIDGRRICVSQRLQ